MPETVLAGSRRQLHRLFDIAVFVWGAATATMLAISAAHDIQGGPWPPALDAAHGVAVIVAGVAALSAGWARLRLRKLRAVLEDERTADTYLRCCTAALIGALTVQLPFLFDVQTPSVAQAKMTLAAALAVYGAAQLWLNRDA
jgi:small basic protein